MAGKVSVDRKQLTDLGLLDESPRSLGERTPTVNCKNEGCESENCLEDIYENERLAALRSLDILDTPEELEYDELVQLASEICGAPISLVSLVDSERQWFKAAIGVDVRETHRNLSFCSHAIQKPEIFIVEDATTDDRFRHNSLVTGEMGVRFYAGVPLHAPSGHAIGALCVIDTIPRTLTDSQKNALVILGRQVKTRMELRHKQKMLEQAVELNEELLSTLAERNKLFTAFMNNGPFVSYIKSEDGTYIYLNEQHRVQFGVEADAWIGRKDLDLFPRNVAEDLRMRDLAILHGGVPVSLSEITPHPDRGFVHWKSYKFPLRLENGSLMLAGMSMDVTEEVVQKAELDRVSSEKLALAKSLENSTKMMQTFIENNPNVCFFKDSRGKYISYNSKFSELFGIQKDGSVDCTDLDILPAAVAAVFRTQDRAVLDDGQVSESCDAFTDPRGATVWMKTFKFPITNAEGVIVIAGVSLDITMQIEKERALSEANQKLELLATTDLLTGLCNRRTFEERIAIDFGSAVRHQRSLALLVLDIDDFKKRNDTYGHAAGDDALRVLGQTLLGAIRAEDMAARIGGEEFAILLPDTDSSGAALLAGRIQAMLREAEHGPLPLTVSVGVASLSATNPQSTENWKRLIASADDAMYEAKKSGKDRFVIQPAYGLSVHDLIGM